MKKLLFVYNPQAGKGTKKAPVFWRAALFNTAMARYNKEDCPGGAAVFPAQPLPTPDSVLGGAHVFPHSRGIF